MTKVWALTGKHYFIATIGFVVWFISAVLLPVLLNFPHWGDIQDVWARWQTLNAGMLALAASIIAFRAVGLRDESEARRNLIATKPFLPEQLSALTTYNRHCFKSFAAAWNYLDKNSSSGVVEIDGLVVPELPDDYRSVFRDLIKYAPEGLSNYLSVILAELQIHDARLRSLPKQLADTNTIVFPISVMDYIRNLGVLQARLNALFPFARGEVAEFGINPMTVRDLREAISVGGIEIDEINQLKEYLEPAVKRANRKVLPDPADVLGESD
ncbi:hypothetical protein [Maricaulis maris]|uniref:hypothetical protein n=1 Tax=Maricaulis maris TaxID=74318 RepID=UPI00059F0C06|nr:hypothetical protein [Maricaulis maris]